MKNERNSIHLSLPVSQRSQACFAVLLAATAALVTVRIMLGWPTIPQYASLRWLEPLLLLLYPCLTVATLMYAFRSFSQYAKVRDTEHIRLFRKNPHPMWIYDVSTLKFLAVNEAALSTYGYSEAEFLNMTIKDIRPEDDVPALLECTDDANVTFDHSFGGTSIWRHRFKNGTLQYVEVSSHQLIYERVKAELVLAYNVTERVLQDQKLHALNQQLEHRVMQRTDDLLQLNKRLIDQNRIIKSANLELYALSNDLREANNKIKEHAELKNKFVSMASHEFRTPLSTIASHISKLKKAGGKMPADEIEKVLKAVETQVAHLNCVLDDVLTLGKKDSGKLQVNVRDLNLQAFISRIVEEVANATGNSHHVRVTMHESTPASVESDENFMRNIFINLLTNAIKYSPKSREVFLDVYPDRNTICFEVRDTGLGVAPEDIEKIFDPFYRCRNTEAISGSGLGLSIVKRAADLLNAHISVKSELGKGTTFKLLLPVK